ncbi:MAG: helix-turn-helix domain-containing protein [Clostridia bacterium]|nr:helix-turn-helix domain-containing protein [Clostridia bacterium]
MPMINAIANVFDVNRTWLETGEGEMLRSGRYVRSSDAEIIGRLQYLAGQMSQNAFASYTGLSVETIQSLLAGTTSLTMRAAETVAEACDVSVDWILYGHEASRRYPCDRNMIRFLSEHEEIRRMIRFVMKGMEEEIGGMPEHSQAAPIVGRLKQVCQHLNLQIPQIARATQTDTHTIRDYLSGKTEVPDAWTNRFCRAYDLNETWLQTGEGQMMLFDEELVNQDGRVASGKRLKKIRDHYHLDQADIATMAGITTGMVSHMERGRAPVSETVAAAIEEKYGISAAWILQGGEGQPAWDGQEEPEDKEEKTVPVPSETAVRFKQMRTELGMSQKETSDALGITKGMISLIETGRTPISEKMYARIEEKLGISRAWLLTGEGEMKKSGRHEA